MAKNVRSNNKKPSRVSIRTAPWGIKMRGNEDEAMLMAFNRLRQYCLDNNEQMKLALQTFTGYTYAQLNAAVTSYDVAVRNDVQGTHCGVGGLIAASINLAMHREENLPIIDEQIKCAVLNYIQHRAATAGTRRQEAMYINRIAGTANAFVRMMHPDTKLSAVQVARILSVIPNLVIDDNSPSPEEERTPEVKELLPSDAELKTMFQGTTEEEESKEDDACIPDGNEEASTEPPVIVNREDLPRSEVKFTVDGNEQEICEVRVLYTGSWLRTLRRLAERADMTLAEYVEAAAINYASQQAARDAYS